ncbi:hypothetical protein N7519_001527 [Penicillium mononematosum]|uniref:uncharacterized protein n=1 Tax=Penicillium mononematosum TaxID=268346 RepID=UPI002549AD49|nr:uncharacterized protein N7519_001527 [Penicillium mononematosum]KAJ6191506.1 hypothetical protein N7519_001527 [Penicillium mononematosum]
MPPLDGLSIPNRITEADKKKVADARPIPAPDNEGLELLTQLRLGRAWRNNARMAIIREARIIRRQARDIRIQLENNGQPPSAQIVWGLRQWLEVLIHNMRILRAEEEAARELEADIWNSVQ